jgi:RNA polymerase sigma factor (sigma-70 family)
MTDSDVSACLEKVRQGDEEAIRALVRYMYPTIYKLVRSNLPRRNVEEDLVQTVLIKVFKNLTQFSHRVPFSHWVSRITVNACLSTMRYEKARPEVRMADLSEGEEEVVKALATSEEKLDASSGLAARELVQQLVSCLKPKDRLLVRLIYLEGLTHEQASESTGWSVGNVTMRISRARIKMRKRHEALIEERRHL